MMDWMKVHFYIGKKNCCKHMQYDRKKMVYTPEIKVYHLEDASTNACIKKARKKMIFIRTEYIKSLTALMEIYEKCDKSKER